MFSSNTSQASSDVNYIEDVFSTYLYTGNGATQTITNGIDLAGKGGLVWLKDRTSTNRHYLYDTLRGAGNYLISNLSNPQSNAFAPTLTNFGSSGFSLGADPYNVVNTNGGSFASWTFRKQPKFFDVVTYSGNGNALTVSHQLGSVPGCIMIKRTNAVSDWIVYHKNLSTPYGPDIPVYYIKLNSVGAEVSDDAIWDTTAPTATTFNVLGGYGGAADVNQSGGTYVAYLFASDSGGFGLTGADNVISCGSYAGNGSANGPVVTLGYEPQWLMVKNATGSGNWQMIDNMRGMPVGSADATLQANISNAESSVDYVRPTATGFQVLSTSSEVNTSSSNYIYIAIRRGPMKVPTTGTSVFSPITSTNSTGTVNTTGFPVDFQLERARQASDTIAVDRLRGISTTATQGERSLLTDYIGFAEFESTTATRAWDNTGFQTPSGFASLSTIYWNFRRAPSFFDEVCYTGTGSNSTVAHNLKVTPELMIVKSRISLSAWQVYSSALANTEYLVLNTTAAKATGTTRWNSTTPTSSVFNLGTANEVNALGTTYVAYLFASCPGVSKVGSYTGTGATQVINCGFVSGARFVLIKATSTTGDWLVWDSARGIVAGNDPYAALNTDVAEVTTTDWVDTAATGFELSNNAGNLANSSGVSYTFLAIA